MNTTLPPRGQIAARGEKLYQERLRTILEPTHNGKFAVINVDTGEYEIDAQHIAALKRARARWPESIFFAVRVGYPTLGRIGARLRSKPEPS